MVEATDQNFRGDEAQAANRTVNLASRMFVLSRLGISWEGRNMQLASFVCLMFRLFLCCSLFCIFSMYICIYTTASFSHCKPSLLPSYLALPSRDPFCLSGTLKRFSRPRDRSSLADESCSGMLEPGQRQKDKIQRPIVRLACKRLFLFTFTVCSSTVISKRAHSNRHWDHGNPHSLQQRHRP